MYEVDRRLWLNQDRTKAVEEGDPEAAFLLATKGRRLSMEAARRLGLVKDEEPVVAESVTEVVEEEQPEVEEKAVESSEAEDKAVRRPSVRTKARES